MKSSDLTEALVEAEMVRLGVPAGNRVAIGVSGGADSTALLLLLHERFDVTVLTVDHGLRTASTGEAVSVGAFCESLSVPHHILTWEGEKPSANIQAEARNARYNLMSRWCRENNVAYLAVAHHMDDQAETVLLRLARGSGVYGLAGMASTRELENVTLVRPLLATPKSDLIDYLEERSIPWIEDPSNRSTAYDRVRIRQMLADPPVEGLRSRRLAATASRLRRSRDALEYYEARWLEAYAQSFNTGHAVLSYEALSSAPEEIVLRGVAELCRFAGNGDYVPRMERLERLCTELRNAAFRGQTLIGAQIVPLDGDRFLFCREAAQLPSPSDLTSYIHWDNRYKLIATGNLDGYKLKQLGPEGWLYLKKSAPEFLVLDVKRVVAMSLPAIFDASGLQVVPHLGYSRTNAIAVSVTHTREVLTKK
ncbi:MAG: tRNA lysidine(34) synthetase TilS [Kordiimonadales bacterium]|nr:MAG: tRNA lysidine(34) synthetase TilS [Kordiimonadales bacterium]